MPKKAGEKMSKSNYIVRGGADFSKIKQEIEKTRKDLKGFKNQIEGFKTFVGAGLKLAGISLGTAALVKFGQQAIKVASDIEEIQNVTDTVFKEMTKDINEFSKGLIQSHGLGELSAKKYASYMGAMLKSSGVHGDAVRSMSKDLTLLTADMASFYNLDTEEMFQKIMSGMSGQTMPLKKLGINLNIANLEAFALSQGIQKTWKEMTQAEQVMLRYNYLMNVTGDAQGDFARNSWNWAHSIKILSEEWKEFMGLLGTALKEILLPTVQFLIDVVRGLNKIARAIGSIYTMITGNEVAVRSNIGLADSAFDAAEGEEELADGIGKATKAAKKALAPFDELNILNSKLASGAGGAGGGLVGGFPEAGSSRIDTSIVTTSREKIDWNLKPPFIPPPVFPDIPTPVYEPAWNLDPPFIVAPVFGEIPEPVYRPKWGLDVPPMPAPAFPPIPVPVYHPDWNLQPPLVPKPIFPPIPSPAYEPVWNLQPPLIPVPVFPAINYAAYSASLEAIGKAAGKIKEGLSTAWGTIETNYKKHKENVGTVAAGLATVLVANINRGLSTVGKNTNAVITTVQNNMQTWGRNIGSVAAETAKNFAGNIAEGYRVTSQNFVSFANSVGQGMKSWGSGVLSIAAETARGFVSNMVSGFSRVWNNFKSLMSSMGERVSGWFSENKSVVVKTAIVAGVVVGAGALALAAPAAIPYIAGALGGLASVPALAKGGVINQPTLAMIGESGREAVMPLENNTGWINELANQLAGALGGRDGDLTVVVKLGEDTITEKVVSNINRQSRISGRTVITV